MKSRLLAAGFLLSWTLLGQTNRAAKIIALLPKPNLGDFYVNNFA